MYAGDIRLVEAAKNNDVRTVRALISQKADAKSTDVDGTSALHWAAQNGSVEIADALLAAGADAVNDVTGLQGDPEMAATVAKAGVPIVIMHNQRDREFGGDSSALPWPEWLLPVAYAHRAVRGAPRWLRRRVL